MPDRRALIVGLILVAAGIIGMSTPFGPGRLGRYDGGVLGMHGGGMMGSMMGWDSFTESADLPEPIDGAPDVRVEAVELRFEPDSPIVVSNVSFNLSLVNLGSVVHDLTVPDLELRLVAGPGETVTAGIRDVAPGSYAFSCTVPGHAAAGMVGLLIVESGS